MIKFGAALVVAFSASMVIGCSADATAPSIGSAHEALSTVDTVHTSTGALVYTNAAGNLRQACSGVLIAPTVFLTAGHCTSDPRFTNDAWVTFDQTVTNAATVYHGIAHTAPQYDPAAYNINADSHDVGVVVLDTPVTSRTPVKLPTANLLGSLHAAPGTTITAVGYGVDQDGTHGSNVTYATDRTRDSGPLKYRALTAYIMADQVAADGACFGDSGGPDFMTVGGQEQLVALSVVVNGYDCNEVAWLYRLDGAATRAFLGNYVTLP